MNLKPKRDVMHGELGIVLGLVVLTECGLRFADDTPDIGGYREGDFVRLTGGGRRAKAATGLQAESRAGRTNEETFAGAEALLKAQAEFRAIQPSKPRWWKTVDKKAELAK